LPDALVTVESYSTTFEANLVRAKLEAYEFHPTLVDAEAVNVNWLWSNALGGVKVQVPEPEAAEALQFLASEPSYEETPPDAAEATFAVCPRCGSQSTEPFIDKRGSFLTWLIAGIPLLPTALKRRCLDCDCKWKVQEPSGY
jgi:hypothetical protein